MQLVAHNNSNSSRNEWLLPPSHAKNGMQIFTNRLIVVFRRNKRIVIALIDSINCFPFDFNCALNYISISTVFCAHSVSLVSSSLSLRIEGKSEKNINWRLHFYGTHKCQNWFCFQFNKNELNLQLVKMRYGCNQLNEVSLRCAMNLYFIAWNYIDPSSLHFNIVRGSKMSAKESKM